jgi:hypothetical protein
MLSLTKERWNDTNWVNDLRKTYKYDEHNNKTEFLWEWGNGKKWRNHIKSFFTYDSLNNKIKELHKQWNIKWIDTYRYTYKYDKIDSMLQVLIERYQNNKWNFSEKWIFGYDENNRKSNSYLYHWIGTAWLPDYRSTFEYDEKGNLLTHFVYSYRLLEWEKSWKQTWTYNKDGYLLTQIFNYWKDSMWTNYNRILSFSDSRERLFTYDKSYKIEIFYTSATGIKNILHQAAIVKLYPNPATDYIDVMLNEAKEPVLSVKVYDVLGNVVVDTPPGPLLIEGERIRLDVSGLAAGVYFVKIGNKMYKFVKM